MSPKKNGKKMCYVEEELAPYDDIPLWYDSNGTRIIPSPKRPTPNQVENQPKKDFPFAPSPKRPTPSQVENQHKKDFPLAPLSSVNTAQAAMSKASGEQDITFQNQESTASFMEEEEDLLFSNDNFSEKIEVKRYSKFKKFDVRSQDTVDAECQITGTVCAHGSVSERRKNLVFTEGEKTKIRENEKLSDESINLVHYMLADSFPGFDGFQDTHQTKLGGWRKLPFQSKYVQILHSAEKDHWVCMASIDGNHVLYDSLRSLSAVSPKSQNNASLIALPFDIQRQIVQYCDVKDEIDIEVCSVQQQDVGTVDCGLFAIASATHLVSGLEVSNTVFDTKVMRKHLIQCLEFIYIWPFKVIR